MPSDYHQYSNILGVGPKISLVFIAVYYWNEQGSGIRDQGSGIREQGAGSREQGAPCNVHMVCIFNVLG
jgi:hypothetical protein